MIENDYQYEWFFFCDDDTFVNTKNLEKFLDVAPTDDNYYVDLNKQLPTGSSNGLAYVDDGYGAVLKI